MTINNQAMILHFKIQFFSDFGLPLLDNLVNKFFNSATLQTYKMIMMC